MLTEPLSELTWQINEFDIEHLEQSKLVVKIQDKNELQVLRDAYNKLVDDLIDFQSRLGGTQLELREANRKLDEQNLMLEQEVARKTATLSRIMLDLEQQRDELIEKQSELKKKLTTQNGRASATEKQRTGQFHGYLKTGSRSVS